MSQILPTLRDTQLSFRIGSLEFSLPELLDGRKGRESTPGELEMPELKSGFSLRPIRKLALRELLSHAASGKVRIVLPLPQRSISAGPVTLDLRAGHQAVIELEVEDTCVIRDPQRTRGTIEPAIPLPLGATFRGLYLDKEGHVIADIENFFDLNLTRWVGQVPKIPANLDELWAALEGDGAPAESSSGRASQPPTLDLSELRVEAREVQARAQSPLSLGEAGEVLLGAETRLDIDYTQNELWVRGRVVLPAATLKGEGFTAEGLAGQAEISWRLSGEQGEREMELHVQKLQLGFASAAVDQDERLGLQLGTSRLDDAAFEVHSLSDGTHFSEARGRLSLDLKQGHFAPVLDGRSCPIHFSPTAIQGSFAYSNRRLRLDLGVGNLGLAIPAAEMQFGAFRAAVQQLSTFGQGRLHFDHDEGLRFEGSLKLASAMGGSAVLLEKLSAELSENSKGRFELRRLVFSHGKLRALSFDGEIGLVLASGSVQLSPNQHLRFLPDTSGSLQIRKLELSPPSPWPEAEASLSLEADTDAVGQGPNVLLPAGNAGLRASFLATPAGLFRVHDVDIRLSTEESGRPSGGQGG